MDKYDVVIVGAGPAGSTAARYSALHGVKTLLIDKKKDIGIPVQCGEFIPTLQELNKVLPKVQDLDELYKIEKRFISRQTTAVRFVTPKMKKYTLDFKGITIERRLFDRHLAVKAVEAGAELRINTRAIGIERGTLKTSSGDVSAAVIIGADGPRSQVASSAGLQPPRELAPCMAYELPGKFGSIVEMYFGNIAPGGYAWVIPKKETVNVGLGVQKTLTNIPHKKLLDRFVDKVCGPNVKPVFSTVGVVPISGPVPKTVQNNVLLVGDAAGHVMATNGGGIPIAMVCGRIAGNVAAEHINSGIQLEKYENDWRAAVGTELETSVRIKKMADKFFGHDKMLEFAMRFMGLKLMDRAVKCKPLFSIHS